MEEQGPGYEELNPARTIIADAAATISGPRREDYGSPTDSFNQIAEFWTAYLRKKPLAVANDGSTLLLLTAHDVINMMILLKVSRASNGYHRDSYLDIIGYSALSEQV